ncbi:MAG: H-NS histone family protein [Brachymonas sp.]|jgi:DNA-binding protein H-NS|nr:H-NS histone family protein [Brachymonas sp.]MBP9652074.1 H-NS histone family protein [Brachymonas sp.]
MNDLQILLQEREAIENKIREARRQQVAQAIATCRKLIEEHALTEADLFGSGKGRRGKSAGTGIKVAPKYRNPATGETWTGRGKPPKWIQGQNRDSFLIK